MERQHEISWKHILGFVMNSLIAGSSSVPSGQGGIYDHHVYTLALVGGNYRHFSVLEGLKARLENYSSSLRKEGDLAQHPTKVASSSVGAAMRKVALHSLILR